MVNLTVEHLGLQVHTVITMEGVEIINVQLFLQEKDAELAYWRAWADCMEMKRPASLDEKDLIEQIHNAYELDPLPSWERYWVIRGSEEVIEFLVIENGE